MTYEEFEKIAEESLRGLNDYASSYSEHDGFTIDDGVIVQKHISGGASGGNCWGDDARYFRNEKSAEEFLPLDRILLAVAPEITYLKYREVQNLIVEGNDHDHEYYGNYTDYLTYSLDVRKLYDLLFPEKKSE